MNIFSEKSRVTGRPPIRLDREIVVAILQIIKGGWERILMSSDTGADDGEVKITECLRDGMREEANTLKIKMRIIVLPGTESKSHPDMDKPDGRTDIPLIIVNTFYRYSEHDPHAVIECKRVADSNTRLCREYVVQGIDRFQSGKYGGNHSTGFMIGYVISGDIQSAILRINRYLEGKSRTAETLKLSNIINQSWVRESTHLRNSGYPIRLHHVFLEFASTKS